MPPASPPSPSPAPARGSRRSRAPRVTRRSWAGGARAGEPRAEGRDWRKLHPSGGAAGGRPGGTRGAPEAGPRPCLFPSRETKARGRGGDRSQLGARWTWTPRDPAPGRVAPPCPPRSPPAPSPHRAVPVTRGTGDTSRQSPRPATLAPPGPPEHQFHFIALAGWDLTVPGALTPPQGPEAWHALAQSQDHPVAFPHSGVGSMKQSHSSKGHGPHQGIGKRTSWRQTQPSVPHQGPGSGVPAWTLPRPLPLQVCRAGYWDSKV
ncbi:hypothetical protein P7K49_033683 [Saguinus oedipus]|uniref:Uncharacterized protein n=1 Tax=Saguinus oedipus TaxID=9490 RepID=A0ABQ9TSM3_SAGOE|nr:hypothetical protein P7K49_033683 [Saguinus oedipus]